MRMLITSDTHGDLTAWNKVLERLGSGIDYIVHAGDVFYYGPRSPLPSTYDPGGLVKAINACPHPLIMVRGNCDADIDQTVLNWPLQDPFALLQVENLRVLATHGEKIPREQFATLAQKYRPSLIVFGHIHQPVLEKEGKTLILNPGSPSLSKYAPEGNIVQTAVLLSDNFVQIFDIDTGQVVISASVE